MLANYALPECEDPGDDKTWHADCNTFSFSCVSRTVLPLGFFRQGWPSLRKYRSLFLSNRYKVPPMRKTPCHNAERNLSGEGLVSLSPGYRWALTSSAPIVKHDSSGSDTNRKCPSLERSWRWDWHRCNSKSCGAMVECSQRVDRMLSESGCNMMWNPAECTFRPIGWF